MGFLSVPNLVRFFEAGDYFKYFHQRGGDYSREAINRGTAIRGNTVYYIKSPFSLELRVR